MHPCLPFLLLCLAAALPLASPSTNPDVKLLLAKVKPALEGQRPNAQLATWNASTPLCLWRGLGCATPDGRPLRCDAASVEYRPLAHAHAHAATPIPMRAAELEPMPVSFDWNTPLLKWPQPKVRRRVGRPLPPPLSPPKMKRSVAISPAVTDLSP